MSFTSQSKKPAVVSASQARRNSCFQEAIRQSRRRQQELVTRRWLQAIQETKRAMRRLIQARCHVKNKHKWNGKSKAQDVTRMCLVCGLVQWFERGRTHYYWR